MHHVIVKSEQAVRAENERLQAEVKRLRADNNRSRAAAGEELLEEPKVHVQAISDIRQFTAGECRVSIVGKGANAPGGPIAPNNPAASALRSLVGPQPLRFNMQTKEAPSAAAQLAALAPPAPGGARAPANTEASEVDDLSQRVALLELK